MFKYIILGSLGLDLVLVQADPTASGAHGIAPDYSRGGHMSLGSNSVSVHNPGLKHVPLRM